MILMLYFSLEYVTPEEWTTLKTLVKVDVEIQIYRIVEDNGHITFVTNPGTCIYIYI